MFVSQQGPWIPIKHRACRFSEWPPTYVVVLRKELQVEGLFLLQLGNNVGVFDDGQNFLGFLLKNLQGLHDFLTALLEGCVIFTEIKE
jgi:hypothetical protein